MDLIMVACMSLEKIYKIYSKFSKYEYVEGNLSTYHIKNVSEFDNDKCGICWDFMSAMQVALCNDSYIHHCYFTKVIKDTKLVATHTYIIVREYPFHYWIECAWQKNKGVHLVFSYKDVERLLKEEYNADELHTTVYDPTKVEGMTANEFFNYIKDEGVILS